MKMLMLLHDHKLNQQRLQQLSSIVARGSNDEQRWAKLLSPVTRQRPAFRLRTNVQRFQHFRRFAKRQS